jgi:hypothetical protein
MWNKVRALRGAPRAAHRQSGGDLRNVKRGVRALG